MEAKAPINSRSRAVAAAHRIPGRSSNGGVGESDEGVAVMASDLARNRRRAQAAGRPPGAPHLGPYIASAVQARDLYGVLGVPKTASQDEIKRVYRRLAKKYHPDMNPGDPEAEERFKRVSAA